jgi:methionine-rich copper-binding protein CopC
MPDLKESPMNTRKLLLPLLLVVSAAVSAHAKLESSNPADKSRVTAPKQLVLEFDDPVVITSLTLQAGTEAAKPIKYTPSPVTVQGFTIPMPTLAPGDYVIAWKVESDDLHTSSGAIHFTVIAAKDDEKDK